MIVMKEDLKVQIISNGLHFIRSITEQYGPDQGMQLWERIAEVLDPNIKGEIFFAMITGEYNNRITLNPNLVSPFANKVEMIKCIRTVDKRRLGLKEAKDMCDQLASGHRVTLECEPVKYHEAITALRVAGFQC